MRRIFIKLEILVAVNKAPFVTGTSQIEPIEQGGKGRSQITNYGHILNTVTDHDKRFLVELRITDLILRQ